MTPKIWVSMHGMLKFLVSLDNNQGFSFLVPVDVMLKKSTGVFADSTSLYNQAMLISRLKFTLNDADVELHVAEAKILDHAIVQAPANNATPQVQPVVTNSTTTTTTTVPAQQQAPPTTLPTPVQQAPTTLPTPAQQQVSTTLPTLVQQQAPPAILPTSQGPANTPIVHVTVNNGTPPSIPQAPLPPVTLKPTHALYNCCNGTKTITISEAGIVSVLITGQRVDDNGTERGCYSIVGKLQLKEKVEFLPKKEKPSQEKLQIGLNILRLLLIVFAFILSGITVLLLVLSLVKEKSDAAGLTIAALLLDATSSFSLFIQIIVSILLKYKYAINEPCRGLIPIVAGIATMLVTVASVIITSAIIDIKQESEKMAVVIAAFSVAAVSCLFQGALFIVCLALQNKPDSN